MTALDLIGLWLAWWARHSTTAPENFTLGVLTYMIVTVIDKVNIRLKTFIYINNDVKYFW